MTSQSIQGLWVSGKLSLMEQLSIKSFLANGHEYHLYVYGDVTNIPPGTVVKDGRDILPESRIFTIQEGWGSGSLSGFADIFRYHLLRLKGGWWVDMDVICLKPFDFAAEHVIVTSFEGQYGELANNCILKMPQDSQLATYLSEFCDRCDPSKVGFGDLSPILIQKTLKEKDFQEYQKYLVPYTTFCPISWREVLTKVAYHVPPTLLENTKEFVKSKVRQNHRIGRITQDSYAVHLWNEIWRQNQLDKNDSFAKNCLYERLKRRYL
jgi:Alpha 1,4-glycosyltransferase conserved region